LDVTVSKQLVLASLLGAVPVNVDHGRVQSGVLVGTDQNYGEKMELGPERRQFGRSDVLTRVVGQPLLQTTDLEPVVVSKGTLNGVQSTVWMSSHVHHGVDIHG
jgi:hypothetical protein